MGNKRAMEGGGEGMGTEGRWEWIIMGNAIIIILRGGIFQ